MEAKVLLGKRIKDIRVKLGLSQEELAFRCETHASHIGFLERGERNPTIDTIERIADGLGIPLHELLNFCEEPQVPVYDQTTNKILSLIRPLSPDARKRLLSIVKAFAKSAKE